MISLKIERIPLQLRSLIPLIERFGILDDSAREKLVAAASDSERAELVAAVRAHDDELDQWLAGPEAKAQNFSDEYVHFSAMRMAADYAAI